MTAHLPDDAEVAAVMSARLLGGEVSDVARVPSFAGNRVFRVRPEAGGGAVYVKFAAAGALATEREVLRVVAHHGVPVPEVEAEDLDGSAAGAPCLALRALAGEPMRARPSFGSVAVHLRRLHGIPVAGYGALTATAGGLCGADETWLEALRRPVSGVEPAVEAGLVPRSLVDAVAAALERTVPIRDVGPPRLLHGDFHPRHVYAEDGRITGIIDWGDATGGDPDYDVARVLHAALLEGDLASALEVAGAVLPAADAPIDADRLAGLLTYAAVFVLGSMRGEYESGSPWPPWWPMQTSVLARIVDAIERVVR